MLAAIPLWILGSIILSVLLAWRRICVRASNRSDSRVNYSSYSTPSSNSAAWRPMSVATPLGGEDRVRRRVAALSRIALRSRRYAEYPMMRSR